MAKTDISTLANGGKMDKNPTQLHILSEKVERGSLPVNASGDQLLVNGEELYTVWPAKMDIFASWSQYFLSYQKNCLNHSDLPLMVMLPKGIKN